VPWGYGRRVHAASSSGPNGAGPLATYRAKRDFTKTPEPAGELGRPDEAGPPGGAEVAEGGAGGRLESAGSALRFVVQRHRARRLHYDLRLEMEGVLASWAVPKGPTLDPSVRRAAFHVEDHPLEYFDFEGVIPKGEYGGGDVIVWDEGTWSPDEAGSPPEPERAVRQGELHFDLRGHKLRGRFVLVRTRAGAPGAGSEREQWLLLHKHDEYAVPGWDPEDYPRSVLSGRTNEEVKADPDRLWMSSLPPAEAAVDLRAPAAPAAAPAAPAAAPAAPAAAPAIPTAAPAAPAAAPAIPTAGELAALDALGAAGTWHLFGRELRVTNLGKVLFPPRPGEEAVTKRDLLRYTAQIAPVATPYLAGRALNMHRFPGGAGTAGFWHKQLPSHAPDWLPRWHNPDAGASDTTTYLVVDEPAALVWAANFGALEWHAWTSRTDHPNLPTYVLIDLDPGEKTSWEDLLVLARLHGTALKHLGVSGQPKLTGGRGIHIWIPITPGPSFAETRAWAESLSRAIGAVVPDLVSWKWQVGERSGLARLDYTQNTLNKTLVAPYSPRAVAGAPVSAPIEWSELDDPTLVPDKFTIRNMPARIAEKDDLFRSVLTGAQQLPRLS
jgi:bifunctional non-homologous end joining protein LigD